MYLNNVLSVVINLKKHARKIITFWKAKCKIQINTFMALLYSMLQIENKLKYSSTIH